MTKNELVRELAEDFAPLPRKQVAEIIEALLEKITAVLKSGDKVQLTPFGQFRIRDRAARIARNPQTGAPVNVPAKRVLKFIAGKPLKEAVGTPRRGGSKAAVAKKKTAAPARKSAVAKKTSTNGKPGARKTVAKKVTKRR